MISRCSQDDCRFFQDDHFKWKIQRNSMIPNYSMIPAFRWSPVIRWSPAIRLSPVIRWSIGSMDFDHPKVYGDIFISDGLVISDILSFWKKEWEWFKTPKVNCTKDYLRMWSLFKSGIDWCMKYKILKAGWDISRRLQI